MSARVLFQNTIFIQSTQKMLNVWYENSNEKNSNEMVEVR